MAPPQGIPILAIYHEKRLVRQMTLTEGHYRIGNDKNLEIPLLYPSVSRLHGVFSIHNDNSQLIHRNFQCEYTDLKSRNGTFLTSAASKRGLEPEKKHVINSNQKLEIGPFSLEIKVSSANQLGHWQKILETKYQEILDTPPTPSMLLPGGSKPSALLRDWCRQGHLEGTGATSENIESALKDITDEEQSHGPFTAYMSMDSCREILANSPEDLYVDIGNGLTPLKQQFRSPASYRAWIQRLVTSAGRRLDQQHPLCEGTLPNGARFQGVLAPLTTGFAAVAIRRFGGAPLDEGMALSSNWLTKETLAHLKQAIQSRKNIVVSGGTSAGKTSLINFLCRYISPSERLITIEDTLELSLPWSHVVSLQARKPNSDGVGEISLRQLVQCSLRMRPDRIIVGECRGAEVIEMLQAMNTGHPGSLTTVHANSARDALHRLELLTLMNATNISSTALRQWIGNSIQIVVHVNRCPQGLRYVQEVCEVQLDEQGRYDLKTLYLRPPDSQEKIHSGAPT